MEQGNFLFISDRYFEKHDPEQRLLMNKEDGHYRPCFFAFADPKEPEILWCVPISSRIDKYERIARSKIERQIRLGNAKPRCNTIRFGYVLGRKSAFLIQNMFPVTKEYITSVYADKNSSLPVKVSYATAKDITVNAKDVLKLTLRGYNYLLFSNVLATRAYLVSELRQAQLVKENEAVQHSVPASISKAPVLADRTEPQSAPASEVKEPAIQNERKRKRSEMER